LSSPIGTDPAKLHPDFKINWATLATEGHVNISDITLPLQARIKDKLDGDVKLTTWTSSIDFFAGGGMRIDVDHPELTMAKAASPGKGTSIRVGKFGADKLAYQGLGRQPHAVRPRTQRVGPQCLGQDQGRVAADDGIHQGRQATQRVPELRRPVHTEFGTRTPRTSTGMRTEQGSFTTSWRVVMRTPASAATPTAAVRAP